MSTITLPFTYGTGIDDASPQILPRNKEEMGSTSTGLMIEFGKEALEKYFDEASTVLDIESQISSHDLMISSETSLSKIWDTPEEDSAWNDL